MVPIVTDICPPEHLVCCENYILVGANCIRKYWYIEYKILKLF